MKVWFGVLGFLTFLVVSYGQQDGKQFCQNIVQCYQDAQKSAADCQQQKPANATGGHKAGGCKSISADKQAQLKKLEGQHRQQIIDCVTSRFNEALPVSPKQSAKCQGASTSPSSDARNKRQATTTSTDDGAGNGNGKGKAKGHGKGKHNGGKGNGCQKQVHQKQNQCKQMSKCCSEVAYCHLKFELSDLHNQIRKLQFDLLEQRRACQKEQGQGNNGTPKPMTGNNVKFDSPIPDQDDDPVQEDERCFNNFHKIMVGRDNSDS